MALCDMQLFPEIGVIQHKVGGKCCNQSEFLIRMTCHIAEGKEVKNTNRATANERGLIGNFNS